jgi:hypothetical protein
MPQHMEPLGSDTLAHISHADFTLAWCAIVGEPPALMLESRSEMIRLLVESIPVAPWSFDEKALWPSPETPV